MLFLKIFHKKSEIPELIKVTTFPCTIGRSIKNTITIDDPSISSEHCILEKRDDGIYLIDQESTNGIFWEGNRIKVSKIDTQMALFLGEIKIILSTDEDTLEKTRIIKIPIELLRSSKRSLFWRLVFPLFLFLIAKLIESYLNNPWTKTSWGDYASTILFTTFSAIVLSYILALISKVMNKSFYFKNFLFILFYFSLTIIVAGIIIPPISFNLELTKYVDTADIDALICIIFFGLTIKQLFTKFSPRKVLSIYVGVLAILMIISMIDFREYDSTMRVNDQVSIPWRNFSIQNHPESSLFASMDKSFIKTDEFRKKELEKKEEINKK